MAYLNTEQVAVRYGFVKLERQPNGTFLEVPDRRQVSEYLIRAKVPTKRRGRAVLVREADMDASLGSSSRPHLSLTKRPA